MGTRFTCVLDVSKIRRELGYDPSSLEDGIKDWIEFYKRYGLKPSPHTFKAEPPL